ncbi:MAG: hypothetical protein WB797_06630 [Nocardioides sp.]
MSEIMGMLPGMGQFRDQLKNFDEREIDSIQAIIQSMTPAGAPTEADRRLAPSPERAAPAAGSPWSPPTGCSPLGLPRRGRPWAPTGSWTGSGEQTGRGPAGRTRVGPCPADCWRWGSGCSWSPPAGATGLARTHRPRAPTCSWAVTRMSRGTRSPRRPERRAPCRRSATRRTPPATCATTRSAVISRPTCGTYQVPAVRPRCWATARAPRTSS